MARRTRILSIDGGGVRALVPAAILTALEEHLRALTGDPATRLADHFDLVAGASSGAILACLYLAPQRARAPFQAREAVELLLARSPAIFRRSLWQRVRTLGGTVDERYASDAFEEIAAEVFGELRLSELVRECVIPTYDIERRRAHFFKQRDARRARDRDFRVRDVLRAATAAPTYFEVPRVRALDETAFALIDGGVFANNPTLSAFAEARNLDWRPTARDMWILSLGTGSVKRPYPHARARDWGLAAWLRPLLDIILCASSETVDYELARIYESVGRAPQYLRLETELDGASPDLDDASPDNLRALHALGRDTAARHADALDRFARALLARDE